MLHFMHTFLLIFCLNIFASLSFAMEQNSDFPEWLIEVLSEPTSFENIDNPRANWESVHPGQKVVSFGPEVDKAVAIIARAYSSSGARGVRGCQGLRPPVVTNFIYGDGYCTSGIIQLAKSRYETISNCGLDLANFIFVHAITAKLGEEPKENHFYYIVNRHRREMKEAMTMDCKEYFSRLNTALKPMPAPETSLRLFRYIDLSHKENLPETGEAWDLSFSSCSTHETINEHFSKGCSRGAKLVITDVPATWCRDIKLASRFEVEEEVMLLDGALFYITAIEKGEADEGTNEMHVIYFSPRS